MQVLALKLLANNIRGSCIFRKMLYVFLTLNYLLNYFCYKLLEEKCLGLLVFGLWQIIHWSRIADKRQSYCYLCNTSVKMLKSCLNWFDILHFSKLFWMYFHESHWYNMKIIRIVFEPWGIIFCQIYHWSDGLLTRYLHNLHTYSMQNKMITIFKSCIVGVTFLCQQ